MEPFDKKIERNCYVLAVSLLICIIFLYVFIPHKIDLTNTCIAYRYFHLYCPGCGGTRAVLYLLHGDILKSFIYHPLVLYTTVLAGIYIIRYTVYIISLATPLREIPYMRLRAVYFYMAIFIIFIQWFIKLALIFLKGVYIIG